MYPASPRETAPRPSSGVEGRLGVPGTQQRLVGHTSEQADSAPQRERGAARGWAARSARRGRGGGAAGQAAGVGARAGARSWDRFPESRLGAAAGERRGRLRHLPGGSRGDKTGETARRGGAAAPGPIPSQEPTRSQAGGAESGAATHILLRPPLRLPALSPLCTPTRAGMAAPELRSPLRGAVCTLLLTLVVSGAPGRGAAQAAPRGWHGQTGGAPWSPPPEG